MVDSITSQFFASATQIRLPPITVQRLTEEQSDVVEKILAEYDSANLSDDDIATINNAFAEAEIKPSAALRDAIESAGYDPAELAVAGSRTAGPPPSRPEISEEFLQALDDVLENYDVENITEQDLQNIRDDLAAAGFQPPRQQLVSLEV